MCLTRFEQRAVWQKEKWIEKQTNKHTRENKMSSISTNCQPFNDCFLHCHKMSGVISFADIATCQLAYCWTLHCLTKHVWYLMIGK